MKANELRIGNYVGYPNWDNDGKVRYFRIRDIYTDDNQIGLTNGHIQVPCSNLDYIEPIPLTEEILLKCGFRKLKLKGMEQHFEYILRKNNSVILLAIYNCDFSVMLFGVCKKIKYLHTLQNAYHVSYEEELEINL